MGTVSPADWRARGRLVDCGDHRLFVVDNVCLERTPILLLHGFPTASWDWQRIWPALAGRFRLVAPDFLGFGFSDKPHGHRYTIGEQADLVETLIAQLEIPRHHILAHDFGDTVAQELLARDNKRGDQRRLLSVSLLNGGLFPETHRPRLAQKLLHSPLGSIMVRLMGRGTVARNMKAIFGPDTPPSRADIDGFWALISYNGGRVNFHRLIRYMAERERHRERWVSALRDARIPLQLINGSADPVSGKHLADRYRELIGDDNIVELPRIGHYPQMEAPDEVARHYIAFLDGQTA